jgi:hypothetical protein
MLTPLQRHEYTVHRYFTVTGSRGGTYRIGVDGTVSNISSQDGAWLYCVAVLDAHIYEQVWLCQKLLIEADEEAFLHVAVRSSGHTTYEFRNPYVIA